MNINKKFYSITRYSIMILVLAYTSYQLFVDVFFGRIFPAIKNFGPLSLMESLKSFFISNQILPLEKFAPTFWSVSLTLLLLFFLLTFFFNRVFCGVICPFGTLQELFGNAGLFVAKKVLKRDRLFVVPTGLDKVLRKIKYLILILTLVPALLFGTDFVFSKLFGIAWFQISNPWLSFKNILKFDLITTYYLIAFVTLIVVLIGSFLFERFYCKYLCPTGALTALFAKLSPNKIRVNKLEETEEVTDTGCQGVCPMNIPVLENEVIGSSECIACQKCVANCQSDKAEVDFHFFGKKVKPFVIILISTIVFFAGIILVQYLGYNSVVTPKKPAVDINQIIFINQYPNIKTETFDTDITLKTLAEDASTSVKTFIKNNKLPQNLDPNTSLIELSDIWEKLSVTSFLELPYIRNTFHFKFNKYLTVKEVLNNYGAPTNFSPNQSFSKLLDQASLSSVVLSYGALYNASYGLLTLEDLLNEFESEKIDVTKQYYVVKKPLDDILYQHFLETIEEETGVTGMTKPASFSDFKKQFELKYIESNYLTLKNVAKDISRFDSPFEQRFIEKKP